MKKYILVNCEVSGGLFSNELTASLSLGGTKIKTNVHRSLVRDGQGGLKQLRLRVLSGAFDKLSVLVPGAVLLGGSQVQVARAEV